MSKKTVLCLIGLICLAVGVYCAVKGIPSKVVAYSLLCVGTLIFFGSIFGVRRVISLVALIAISLLVFYLVVYVLKMLGIVLQVKGRTAILIVAFLFTYIISSSFTKRT